MTKGHTLIELAIVLALLAMSGSALAPAARRYRDNASAAAARESVIASIATARSMGVGQGGASVHLESPQWVRIVHGDSVVNEVDLARSFGATMRLGGGRPAARIVFDALGLGRLASRTVILESGSAQLRVGISSFGRVRRE